MQLLLCRCCDTLHLTVVGRINFEMDDFLQHDYCTSPRSTRVVVTAVIATTYYLVCTYACYARFKSRLREHVGPMPGFQVLRFAYSRRMRPLKHSGQLPQTMAKPWSGISLSWYRSRRRPVKSGRCGAPSPRDRRLNPPTYIVVRVVYTTGMYPVENNCLTTIE